MFLFLKALTTSKYKGSPLDPASLVRSSTATFLTPLGKTFKKYLELKGLYKCTSTSPTLLPLEFK